MHSSPWDSVGRLLWVGAGWEQVVGRDCGERWQDLGDISGLVRRPSAQNLPGMYKGDLNKDSQ